MTRPRTFSRVLRPVALAAVAAMALGACALPGSESGGGKKLTAEFESAVSIYPNNSVKILGLPAGKINSITAVGDKVRMELTLNKDVKVPVDVHATIIPASLIGERYLQLFPVWTEGQPEAKDNEFIPLERTEVPVEPDEALAALKEFLDSLDPNATGRLVKNLGDDLQGNGRPLNTTIKGLADLTTTLASKDAELGRIIDHFDNFVATLRTREGQLGDTMEKFAQVTDLLADERRTIESLVKNLATFSTGALDLVAEHRTRLEKDIETLTRTLQTVRANLDQISKVVDAGPLTAKGLLGAYNPKYNRIETRLNEEQFESGLLPQLLCMLGLPQAVCQGALALAGGQQSGPPAPPAVPSPAPALPDAALGLPALPQLPACPLDQFYAADPNAPAGSLPVCCPVDQLVLPQGVPSIDRLPFGASAVCGPPPGSGLPLPTPPALPNPLGNPGGIVPPGGVGGLLPGGTIGASPSVAEAVADHLGDAGGFLRRAAKALVGGLT